MLVQGPGDSEAVIGWPGPAGMDGVGRMAPLPFLILDPVHHKSTTLPSPPWAWPWSEREPRWGTPQALCVQALQSGGWQAPWHLRRWTSDPLGLGPTPASSRRLPVLLRHQAASQRTKCAQCQPVCLSFPPAPPPGAFSFQGRLQPGSLRCVRAWGLRSFCLAQIHILFLFLCNNPCSWRSRGELGPEGEAEAAASRKPLAWLCRCGCLTPSRCTVSMV